MANRLDGPTALVGQSMGGYVAMRLALAAPHLVSHLVLAVTSAGVDTAALGATDWRPGARAARPSDPEWTYEPQPHLDELLPTVTIPTLLLWADRDPISPLAVGQHLDELLPNAELVVYESDDHWVVRVHAEDVAGRIRRFLEKPGTTAARGTDG